MSIPTHFDNAPDLRDEAKDPIWIRFSIQAGERFRVGYGATKHFRWVGVAFAQIFYTKLKDGTAVPLERADQIREHFELTDQGGVNFKVPRVTQLGRQGDAWVTNVEIPWYAEDFK